MVRGIHLAGGAARAGQREERDTAASARASARRVHRHSTRAGAPALRDGTTRQAEPATTLDHTGPRHGRTTRAQRCTGPGYRWLGGTHLGAARPSGDTPAPGGWPVARVGGWRPRAERGGPVRGPPLDTRGTVG